MTPSPLPSYPLALTKLLSTTGWLGDILGVKLLHAKSVAEDPLSRLTGFRDLGLELLYL